MADNFQVNVPTTSGDTFAADDIGGIKHQRVKVQHGADGSATDVSSASPMPVTDALGATEATLSTLNGKVTAVNTGAVVVSSSALPSGAATSAKQDDQTTALQLIDDIVATIGSAITAKAAAVAGTDGTNARILKTDASGELQVDVLTLPAIPAGTNNIGDVDVLTVPAPLSTTGGGTEATALRVTIATDSTGVLSIDDNGGSLTVDGTVSVSGTVTVGSHAVTNAGTFAVQESGAALTALQLIDDAVKTDDAAFTPATDKVLMVGAEFDDTTPDSVNEGDAGAVRMSANRNLYATIRDAAGNERGVNVTAGNALTVDASATTQPVSAASLPLPTGAATSAKQDTEITALQLIDDLVSVDGVTGASIGIQIQGNLGGTATTLAVTAGGALLVSHDGSITCNTELNTAAALADAAAANVTTATVGSIPLLMNATTVDRARAVINGQDSTGTGIQAVGIVAQVDDTTTGTVTENQFGPVRMSTRRALLVEGVASGTVIPVSDGGGTLTVDGTVAVSGTVTIAGAVTNAGTFAVQESGAALTALQLIDDTVATTASAIPTKGIAISGTDGTNARVIKTDTSGELQVDVLTMPTVTVNSHAVTNAGTFAVQDSEKLADDAAFTVATTKVQPVGLLADETSPDSVNEGDVGAPRMTLDRMAIVTVRPNATGEGLDIFRSIDVDETEEEIKATAGKVYGWFLYNAASATRFIKFYNATAASVSVGTTTPVLTIPLASGAAANVEFTNGIPFSTAICIAATTAVADSDTGAPGANEIIANVFYK